MANPAKHHKALITEISHETGAVIIPVIKSRVIESVVFNSDV
jgi:hypothetical protein